MFITKYNIDIFINRRIFWIISADRSRSRKRRDFFGTIRKRLSRSKTRSKSMDPGEYDESNDPDQLNRSISADRARDPSAHSTGKMFDHLLSFLFPLLKLTIVQN